VSVLANVSVVSHRFWRFEIYLNNLQNKQFCRVEFTGFNSVHVHVVLRYNATDRVGEDLVRNACSRSYCSNSCLPHRCRVHVEEISRVDILAIRVHCILVAFAFVDDQHVLWIYYVMSIFESLSFVVGLVQRVRTRSSRLRPRL